MNLYAKSNGIWVVDFTDENGNRCRKSTGTRDKAEAKRRAPAILRGEEVKPEVVAAKPAAAPLGSTMKGLFRRCMNHPEVWRNAKSQATLRSNERIINAIPVTRRDGTSVEFGDLLLTEVDKRILEEVKEYLLAKNYRSTTVKRKMVMIGRALSEAVDRWDILEHKPRAKPVKITVEARKRVLSEKEEAAVFAALEARQIKQPTGDWLRMTYLFRFLLDTGCRKGEAEKLRLHWIVKDGDRHYLELPGWATKSGKGRSVPLSSRIIAMLPYLSANGVKTADDDTDPGLMLFPFKGNFIWYRWQSIVADVRRQKGLDLSDCVIHSLRHTTVTRLLKGGMDIDRVADWVGHSDPQVTRGHYRHADRTWLDAGLEVLEAG